jgi:hypothetical protein
MGGSKIRTETGMSAKPRRRKWTFRALATVVLATGSVASLAGPAQAYDSSTCLALTQVPVTDVDRFKKWNGIVDFGDGLHLGGSPLGDAVVCWGAGAGDVVIAGKLYADSPTAINAAADVRYYRTDGSYSTSSKMMFFGSNGQSKALQFAMPGAATVYRVVIRLWTCWPTNSGVADCSHVNSAVLDRGD